MAKKKKVPFLKNCLRYISIWSNVYLNSRFQVANDVWWLRKSWTNTYFGKFWHLFMKKYTKNAAKIRENKNIENRISFSIKLVKSGPGARISWSYDMWWLRKLWTELVLVVYAKKNTKNALRIRKKTWTNPQTHRQDSCFISIDWALFCRRHVAEHPLV